MARKEPIINKAFLWALNEDGGYQWTMFDTTREDRFRARACQPMRETLGCKFSWKL